ncbi:leucine-rich repeat-containing G-protein coupled receptor 5 [Helicoverpa zea]|uniref:leucine-rich repeat-containing G-protein coupled receptor 5 n=1 Tax=Helicoverpa zea TaxID=7113 RepID=UPI001F576196|nr:leucine-rich repeat-containing G-protein coupled receptor 5 [Helicoverpa zea]
MWLMGAFCVLCAFHSAVDAQWRCPGLSARPAAECSCDLPHTLRCAGDHTALQIIGRHLREQKARNKNTAVSLLDCALRGVSVLSSASVSELAGVGLHGLVISSGDIRRVQQGAFSTVSATLFALGLPNNQLPIVPTEALTRLWNLDRLDLSNNKIHTLDSNSFKGITNLTYLDISDNQLTDISEGAFLPLIRLSVLRLRGNLLKVPALAPLKEAHMLRDLDLSSNALEGPLGPTTVPTLSCLTTLQLSDNTFASIRRGALSGLTNLTHLNLHNNQIDVLEDYAFKHIANLTHLDLSHNEIVAVSGASLAQLTSLVHLDLSHNFLRSLSAEPLKSLRGLTELLLHDNDISMIDDGALALHKDLGRFTIEDNPLNCDCLMAGFARWLREAKNLPQTDKSVAVCATPPHLEGALLSRLSKNKLCDDSEHTDLKQKDTNYDFNKVLANSIFNDYKINVDDSGGEVYVDKQDGLDDDLYDEELEVPAEEDLPISEAKVRLIDAWHDDEEVHLSWAVEPLSNRRYRCTGVTASRAGGLPKHVACHRASPSNVVLRGLKIDAVDQYTFCIALEEMDSADVPLSLVLGCGAPMQVRQRATFATVVPIVVTRAPEPSNPLRVSEVRSNVTSDGVLTVLISVLGLPQRPQYVLPRSQRLSNDVRPIGNCYIVVAVLSRGSLVAQKDTPCQSTLEISMEGFMRGPYEVYTRCQLTRELLKNNFSRTFLSNWVCLIEQESDRNTSAMVVKSPRRKFYGLFQIGSEWCKEGKKGGKCDITCEALLDEDIKDDGICAVKVFEQEGFKYWAKWEARCKGQLLPDIEKCPDWVHPPNRASPPRDKRTARGKRSLRKSRRAIFTNPLF